VSKSGRWLALRPKNLVHVGISPRFCAFLSHFCRPYFPNNRKYISSSSKFSTSLYKVCQLLVFYSTVCALVSSARMIFWLRMIGTLYIYIYKWRLAWRIRNAIDYSYATGHSSKGIALLHYCNCLQISKPISINFIIFIAVIRNLKLSLVYQSINQSAVIVLSSRSSLAFIRYHYL